MDLWWQLQGIECLRECPSHTTYQFVVLLAYEQLWWLCTCEGDSQHAVLPPLAHHHHALKAQMSDWSTLD